MLRQVILQRALLSIAAGLLLGILITEASYRFLRTAVEREPQKIELVIPAGTAASVEAGQVPPGIPSNMTFVIGDTLVVKNQDVVAHQLGPLFIPPGSSASLELSTAQSYAYTCSFNPSRYIGLDVSERVTLATRLVGILSAGLPMGILFALYSIVGIPYKKTEPKLQP